MNIAKVEAFDHYFDTAYRASGKVVIPKNVPRELRRRLYEKQMAKVFYNSLYKQLTSVIKRFPRVEDLTPFYTELIETVIEIDKYKKSLGAINWARFMVKKMYFSFLKKKVTVKQLYGRSKSSLKQVKKEFLFLENSRKKMLRFPSVKSLPTVLIAGFPNVGKTSLLSKITSSKPEVNSYPFTTKNINIGVLVSKNYKIQVVDTPGILEGSLRERNVIEKKAIVALKHLASVILYIFDSSGTSGFLIKDQKNLFKEVKILFKGKEIYTVTNKCELDKSLKTDFYISCVTNEGIDDLKKFLIKTLLKKK